MAITALPAVPSRSDPANFADEADAFLGALPTFATEANALAADVNNKQTAAAASETNAANSATNAANSATLAANSALISASASGASLWVSGTNYAQYAVAVSPSTLLSYRTRVAITGSTIDPASDSSRWRVLNGVTFVQIVTSASVNCVAGGHYLVSYSGPTELIFPNTAFQGDEIWVTVANNLDSNYINRNGLTFMGLPENCTLDYVYVTAKFRYVDSTWRWV